MTSSYEGGALQQAISNDDNGEYEKDGPAFDQREFFNLLKGTQR